MNQVFKTLRKVSQRSKPNLGSPVFTNNGELVRPRFTPASRHLRLALIGSQPRPGSLDETQPISIELATAGFAARWAKGRRERPLSNQV
ncbi:hypothetical protein RRG08_050609 [Elysia crispata]|uniref:Uncharacterized protein n=1 Tax=Elysia crispata TaxID=231223 RepID=A0AAE1E2A2_9GAST|nr:hypothetical protein RRG08_050609 [Elysia crispata]